MSRSGLFDAVPDSELATVALRLGLRPDPTVLLRVIAMLQQENAALRAKVRA